LKTAIVGLPMTGKTSLFTILTGVHETTRLCLEALEDLVQPGIDVLDVGTGSGILAQAARLLGAARVIACDIDPEAVRIARQGFIGSADAVRSAAVDLVVANISPEAIIALAPEFARVLRPGGTLVASGFNVGEVEAVKAALPRLVARAIWALPLVRKELVKLGLVPPCAAPPEFVEM